MICQFINKLKGLKLSLHGASAHSGIVNVLSKLRGSGLGFEIGDLFDPVCFARICTNRAISGIQRRGWHHFEHTRLGKCGSPDAGMFLTLFGSFWYIFCCICYFCFSTFHSNLNNHSVVSNEKRPPHFQSFPVHFAFLHVFRSGYQLALLLTNMERKASYSWGF